MTTNADSNHDPQLILAIAMGFARLSYTQHMARSSTGGGYLHHYAVVAGQNAAREFFDDYGKLSAHVMQEFIEIVGTRLEKLKP